MMKIKISLFTSALILSCTVFCQNSKYKMNLWETEEIGSEYSLIGTNNNNVLLIKTMKGEDGSSKVLYSFDRKTKEILPIKELQTKNGRIIGAFASDNLIVVKGYYTLPQEYQNVSLYKLDGNFSYQDIWIQKKDKLYQLDRIHEFFIDKYLGYSISKNGDYVVNSLYLDNSVGYGNDDGIIYLYDLRDIDKTGKAKKEEIRCEMCKYPIVLGDSILYSKETEYGLAGGNISSDLFIAPIQNMNDTTLIAVDVSIKAISSNGKYIMGIKNLYGEDVNVIVDRENKRLQYMFTNRNYAFNKCFYLPQENKFVCDDQEGYLIYFDMPDKFPFDALEGRFKEIWRKEASEFWEGMKHYKE